MQPPQQAAMNGGMEPTAAILYHSDLTVGTQRSMQLNKEQQTQPKSSARSEWGLALHCSCSQSPQLQQQQVRFVSAVEVHGREGRRRPGRAQK